MNINGQSSSSSQKYLGVTPPIALNGPTKRDHEVTETLLAELKKEGVYESAEESKLR